MSEVGKFDYRIAPGCCGRFPWWFFWYRQPLITGHGIINLNVAPEGPCQGAECLFIGIDPGVRMRRVPERVLLACPRGGDSRLD